MSARLFAPKLAGFAGAASKQAARPILRSAAKPQTTSRAFTQSAQTTRSAPKTSPFQTLKRQQASNILKHTSRNAFSQSGKRFYSSEIAQAMVAVSQNIGMGSAAIGLTGAGIGIGMVFSALLLAVARNPSLRGPLFTYAILGFAFVEAIGLFDLMLAFMIKFL